MRWPWQKRRRRRHSREPWKQWDSARARTRILNTIEALALQGRQEYDRVLELVPFEALTDERHELWNNEPWLEGVRILLECQLIDCLDARRLAPEPGYRIEFLDELAGLELQIALAEIEQQKPKAVTAESKPMEKSRHETPNTIGTADLN